MTYVSTRGGAAPADFEAVLLAGLAPDGGLYMPAAWPQIASLPTASAARYAAAAAHVMAPYTDENPGRSELFEMAAAAYSGFDHPEIAPLREIGKDLFLLELFHGPTLAFKDFAMQMLSRLMERALKRSGGRTTILGATSGDTGAAAVEAFRGRQDIELFILFPKGRVSDVQRRQMTTAEEDNVHAIAIEGTFDDAQAIVKALFADAEFRSTHSLSAINSINWARIMAQTVYYYTACAKLAAGSSPAFSVPTGNFGDIFAAYAALKMGLPVGELVIATNENDILARALASGRYEPQAVMPTDSPSMDIQVSSNFERLLFEESGRDSSFVANAMAALKKEGGFNLPPFVLDRIRGRFSAIRVDREEAALAMRNLLDATGVLVDPHTAVALAAAERTEKSARRPVVVLATAHPAKFPDAVKRATGRTPKMPQALEQRLSRQEHFATMPNSAAAVAAHIRANSVSSSRGRFSVIRG